MRPTRLAAVLAGLAAVVTLAFVAGAAGGTDNQKVRWDLVSIDPSAGTVSAGGIASARANDNSKITLTGHGTFKLNPHKRRKVTGGGTWRTFAPDGHQTASGNYRVTELVRFEFAPGALPPLTDLIADGADARAGFAELQISYSDGSRGVLVISCMLVGSPPSMFEGITTSKGFVGYWNREAPQGSPFVDANRTLFHVID